MDEIKSEFGEVIDDKILEEITKKVFKLTKDQIDLLWYNCGFIYVEKDDNKALPQKHIDEIKSSFEMAENHVGNLLMETKIEDVKKELNKLTKFE